MEKDKEKILRPAVYILSVASCQLIHVSSNSQLQNFRRRIRESGRFFHAEISCKSL